MDIRQAAEIIAASFHRTYEELAPEHGHREITPTPWLSVADKDRRHMVHTVEKLLESGVIRPAAPRPDDEALTGPPIPPARRGFDGPGIR
jgi:hypothetical protein